jgi:hypothetical protein
MSQHHILTKQYEILIGWDRPLRYFFGTVWDKAQLDSDDEGIVFATLSLPGGVRMHKANSQAGGNLPHSELAVPVA